jgi:hypothetical protein
MLFRISTYVILKTFDANNHDRTGRIYITMASGTPRDDDRVFREHSYCLVERSSFALVDTVRSAGTIINYKIKYSGKSMR